MNCAMHRAHIYLMRHTQRKEEINHPTRLPSAFSTISTAISRAARDIRGIAPGRSNGCLAGSRSSSSSPSSSASASDSCSCSFPLPFSSSSDELSSGSPSDPSKSDTLAKKSSSSSSDSSINVLLFSPSHTYFLSSLDNLTETPSARARHLSLNH